MATWKDFPGAANLITASRAESRDLSHRIAAEVVLKTKVETRMSGLLRGAVIRGTNLVSVEVCKGYTCIREGWAILGVISPCALESATILDNP